MAKGLLDSPVLVIGAAHVDVFADYNQKDAENLDKIGTVRFSVGGTAYNIAVNLGQNRIPVELITVIRDKSFPSIWIAERLESAGVATGNMQLVENARDSGFVAIRCQGELENAVTATAIGSVPLNTPNTDAAIQRAKLVVLDCNLPTHEIAQLLEAAHFARKPTLVAAVSDSKVTKLVERQNKTRFEIDVVVLNLTELRAVTDPQYRPLTRANATEICGLLGAKHVIVTMGADGHTVVTSGHDPQSFPAPTVEGFVSSTGAGDALTAGVLAYWYQNLQLDFRNMVPTVNQIVSKVLQEEGATAGALASEADFRAMARIARRQMSFREKLLTAEGITALTGVLIAIFTVGLFLLDASRHEPHRTHAHPSQPAISPDASSAASH